MSDLYVLGKLTVNLDTLLDVVYGYDSGSSGKFKFSSFVWGQSVHFDYSG